MTRRSLLKGLAAAVACMVLPVAIKQRTEKMVCDLQDNDPIPRYEFRDGEFHRVPNHPEDPTLNEVYLNAAFEMTYIMHPEVYKIQFA